MSNENLNSYTKQNVLVLGWNDTLLKVASIEDRQRDLHVKLSGSCALIIENIKKENVIEKVVTVSRYVDDEILSKEEGELVIPMHLQVKNQINLIAAGVHFIVFSDSRSSLWTVGFKQLAPNNSFSDHDKTASLLCDNFPVRKISAGDSHFLVLHSKSREVYAAGSCQHGECGIGEKKSWINFPLISSIPEACLDISAGMNFSSVVSISGLLYTFGCGAYYRLGKFSSLRFC